MFPGCQVLVRVTAPQQQFTFTREQFQPLMSAVSLSTDIAESALDGKIDKLREEQAMQ